MYKAFYKLRDYPFDISPDPRYLHLTRGAHDALACLFYSLGRRRGFVLLTGEVGTGKTTLLNCLLLELRKHRIPYAFVVNPRLNPTEFLAFVLSEFGIGCPSREKGQMLRHLQHWLRELQASGRTAVLVVDEAHTMSLDLLEEIRLLTNLETSTSKLLQVVLSGQPEIEDKLKLPQMRQVKQRIVLHTRLRSLSPEETEGYISTRLKRAGANGQALFSPEAIRAIGCYSKGIPRLINLICENALISGFAAQMPVIPADLVEAVAKDFELETEPIPPQATPQLPSELPTSLQKILSDPKLSDAFLDFLQLLGQSRNLNESRERGLSE